MTVLALGRKSVLKLEKTKCERDLPVIWQRKARRDSPYRRACHDRFFGRILVKQVDFLPVPRVFQ